MDLKTNVLIIGGGPAGATAAQVLAGNGIDVVLLERNLSFIKPCGGAIPAYVFDEFNIPRTAMKKEVTHIKLISPTDEEIHMELKGGPIAIVTRGEFEPVLRYAAENQGAQVVEGECIRIVDDKFYKTEVHSGKEKTVIVSEYIIAADGVNSRVRTLLGIKPCQAIFTVSEHIKDTVTACCEFWFGSHHAPRFYSWVFPTADGSSFGTGTFDHGKTNVLIERFKKRRKLNQAGHKRVYRIPVWKGDIYNKGRILFVGDAAGHVLPFTFEGIYYAMKAGELAAQAIIKNKAEKYKKMWKDRFQKKFAMMKKLQNFFFKDDASAEKMIALHRIQEVQEASLRLWVQKDSTGLGLKQYAKLFGKFLS